MEREYVDSKAIKSIGYDSSTSTLEIEFIRGEVWQYYDFPEACWYDFRSAGSIGIYFNANIRNQYLDNRIG